jgi:acetylornithine deacetylase
LTVRGQAAHSSRPDLGLNAIEDAARLVEMAKGVAAQLEKEISPIPELERPWVTFNVGRIHGGTAVNIVPDHCQIELGYRPLPGMEPEAVYARLKEAVPADLKSRTEVRLVRVTPALLTPEGTPLQHLLSDHARHPHCGAATFATDGGNLAKLGMKPLVFGPGSINVAHQADEYLEHQALLDAIDIIEDVVRRQCCVRESAS